ncbi:protein phosphatase 2C domain-containing protein [Streptomyces sp. NPDC056056]|uniref:protein phosphatase 2C domain-containing protein n=1 Tax=Streptomyces sp. NPDC056056 TaxID=3345698 RepID=UPI0035DC11FD
MRLPDVHVSAFSSACPGRANEDFATWNDSVVVLLDGAGMPSELQAPCVHGVAWFARTLGTTMCAMARGGVSLPDSLAAAITQTADLHRDTCSVDDPLSPSATLAAFRVREGSVDWLVLGDCTLVLDHRGALEVISDNRLASVAQDERVAMKMAPPNSEERRQLHSRLVQAERALRNQPRGYWVGAADPRAASEALYGSYPRGNVTRIALMTDGAARLATTFSVTDWAGCLKILEDHGPEWMISMVRQAELSDVGSTRWPRSKPHDDATAIYVRL